MRCELIRYEIKDSYCLGKLIIRENDNIIYNCETLERGGKASYESNKSFRIPKGIYKMELTYSSKLKEIVPLLSNGNVSASRRILIHVGNTIDDTSGCILVGTSINFNKPIPELKYSRVALRMFLSKIKEYKIKSILIKEDYNE